MGALATTEAWIGRLENAAADGKKAIELGADHSLLSQIYVLQGRPQDALPEIERVQFGYARAFMFALAYHALGREKESEAMLSELIAKYHATSAYEIAEVYAFRNQSDKAFEWLDRAYAQRDSGLAEMKIDPFLKRFHNDARYLALLKKLNLPH